MSQVVRDEIARLLRELGKDVPATLTDQDHLDFDLGLTSLDVTTVLTRLSEGLDRTAARALLASTDLATVGDVSRAYRAAADGVAAAPHDELAASRRRAAGREAVRRPWSSRPGP
jgi:acyl carrier protein